MASRSGEKPARRIVPIMALHWHGPAIEEANDERTQPWTLTELRLEFLRRALHLAFTRKTDLAKSIGGKKEPRLWK